MEHRPSSSEFTTPSDNSASLRRKAVSQGRARTTAASSPLMPFTICTLTSRASSRSSSSSLARTCSSSSELAPAASARMTACRSWSNSGEGGSCSSSGVGSEAEEKMSSNILMVERAWLVELPPSLPAGAAQEASSSPSSGAQPLADAASLQTSLRGSFSSSLLESSGFHPRALAALFQTSLSLFFSLSFDLSFLHVPSF
mmetsp:Transcript_33152/g.79348  ORF Transcript_33152/g.79348 Transcript_33152/m.79348 type:complete len:200 (-) Transcript_33152:253-852(-)